MAPNVRDADATEEFIVQYQKLVVDCKMHEDEIEHCETSRDRVCRLRTTAWEKMDHIGVASIGLRTLLTGDIDRRLSEAEQSNEEYGKLADDCANYEKQIDDWQSKLDRVCERRSTAVRKMNELFHANISAKVRVNGGASPNFTSRIARTDPATVERDGGALTPLSVGEPKKFQ